MGLSDPASSPRLIEPRRLGILAAAHHRALSLAATLLHHALRREHPLLIAKHTAAGEAHRIREVGGVACDADEVHLAALVGLAVHCLSDNYDYGCNLALPVLNLILLSACYYNHVSDGSEWQSL